LNPRRVLALAGWGEKRGLNPRQPDGGAKQDRTADLLDRRERDSNPR